MVDLRESGPVLEDGLDALLPLPAASLELLSEVGWPSQSQSLGAGLGGRGRVLYFWDSPRLTSPYLLRSKAGEGPGLGRDVDGGGGEEGSTGRRAAAAGRWGGRAPGCAWACRCPRARSLQRAACVLLRLSLEILVPLVILVSSCRRNRWEASGGVLAGAWGTAEVVVVCGVCVLSALTV